MKIETHKQQNTIDMHGVLIKEESKRPEPKTFDLTHDIPESVWRCMVEGSVREPLSLEGLGAESERRLRRKMKLAALWPERATELNYNEDIHAVREKITACHVNLLSRFRYRGKEMIDYLYGGLCLFPDNKTSKIPMHQTLANRILDGIAFQQNTHEICAPLYQFSFMYPREFEEYRKNNHSRFEKLLETYLQATTTKYRTIGYGRRFAEYASGVRILFPHLWHVNSITKIEWARMRDEFQVRRLYFDYSPQAMNDFIDHAQALKILAADELRFGANGLECIVHTPFHHIHDSPLPIIRTF